MIKISHLLLLFTFLSTPLYADRGLDAKQAEKKEIRHSMIGFRNTLIFYTFKEQRTIMTLAIDNKDDSFAIKAKVYLFDKATPMEGLAKWINNQHSDGLFPDVPNPVQTVELPKGTTAVTAKKITGKNKNPSPVVDAMFSDYEVQLSVKEYTEAGKFKLSAFTDQAKVHVKSK